MAGALGGHYSKPSLSLRQGGKHEASSSGRSGMGWRDRGGSRRRPDRCRWGGAIRTPDLREWLTYLSSDELEGLAVFTAGYGLAAVYVGDHLHAFGVKPAGDHGSYLQSVRVIGVKTTSRATVSVSVNGETRTLADGEAMTFQKHGRQAEVHGRSC